MTKVPIGEQIACIDRELRYRLRVYPRWVEAGKMTPNKAREELRRLEAVLETLKEIESKGRLI